MIVSRSTGDILRREICAEPLDDVRRLVYADYLQENGRVRLAEYIRQAIASGTETRTSLGDGICIAGNWPKPWPLFAGYGASTCVVRRGFVAEVEFFTLRHPGFDFEKVILEVVARNPVEVVRLPSVTRNGRVDLDGMPAVLRAYRRKTRQYFWFNQNEADAAAYVSRLCLGWAREECGFPPAWAEIVNRLANRS